MWPVSIVSRLHLRSGSNGLAIERGSPRTVEWNRSVNRHYRAWGDGENVGHLGRLGRLPPFKQTFPPISPFVPDLSLQSRFEPEAKPGRRPAARSGGTPLLTGFRNALRIPQIQLAGSTVRREGNADQRSDVNRINRQHAGDCDCGPAEADEHGPETCFAAAD